VEQPPPRPAGDGGEEAAAPRPEIHEGDLRGALGNDSLSEEELRQIEEERARAEAAAALREEDYQLAYAIDILKGLAALATVASRTQSAQGAMPAPVSAP